MVTTSTNTERFARAMSRYVTDLRKEAPKVVKFQARKLLERLVQLTPPKTLSQGRNAVQRDILRAMRPLDAAKVKNPRLRALVRAQDLNAVNAFFRRSPGWQAYEAVPLDPATYHLPVLSRRGRVLRDMKRFVLDGQSLRAYIRLMQSHVGRLRAGFWPALRSVGGRLPGWVTRHGNSEGVVVDLTRDLNNPRIQVSNHSAGVAAAIDEDLLDHALAGRAQDMERDVERILRGGRTRAGFMD